MKDETIITPVENLSSEEYDRLDRIQVKLLKEIQDKQKPTLAKLFPALKDLKCPPST
jgi:hypothetical protein